MKWYYGFLWLALLLMAIAMDADYQVAKLTYDAEGWKQVAKWHEKECSRMLINHRVLSMPNANLHDKTRWNITGGGGGTVEGRVTYYQPTKGICCHLFASGVEVCITRGGVSGGTVRVY